MLTRLGCDVLDMGVVPTCAKRSSACADRSRRHGRRGHHVRRRFGRRGGLRQGIARQARRSAVLENRDEAGPTAGVRPHRQRAFLRPAGQSGFGDGDVLRIRAGRIARAAGSSRVDRGAADLPGAAHRARQENAGTEPNSSAACSRRTATGDSPCARRATRARGSCRRCRARTASSCCRPSTPATAPSATWSRFSCWKGLILMPGLSAISVDRLRPSVGPGARQRSDEPSRLRRPIAGSTWRASRFCTTISSALLRSLAAQRVPVFHLAVARADDDGLFYLKQSREHGDSTPPGARHTVVSEHEHLVLELISPEP